MKNKTLLVRDMYSGSYGHAILIEAKGNKPEHWQVRHIDDYDHLHIFTAPTFYIYYEVLDNEEARD